MDINVQTTDYQAAKRGWYLGSADMPGFIVTARLDVSAFTANTHYPNGYLMDGILLGKITAQSTTDLAVVGPYDDAADDGREVFFGLLFDPVKVPNLADLTKDAAGPVLVAFAPIRLSKLPIALEAPGQADNTRLYYVA